jgi:CheY-like chemotaxis protein
MSQPCRILLVEDIPMAQILARVTLERMGNTYIDIAESGESALDQLAKENYDLILMDIGLPGMDGIETTKQIRTSDHAQKDITIVALTANEDASVKEDCFKAGMHDYIAKPLTLQKANDILKQYICLSA